MRILKADLRLAALALVYTLNILMAEWWPDKANLIGMIAGTAMAIVLYSKDSR